MIDLVKLLVFFFAISSAFFRSNSAIEIVEETFSFDGLNNSSGFVGLLMLLLLLDLLLGGVFAFLPLDFGSFELLYHVVVAFVDYLQ